MGKAKKEGGTRRKGRVLAFQILYSQNFSFAVDEEDLLLVFQQNAAVIEEISPAVLEFAEKLFLGVFAEGDKIDQLIEKFSQHWKMSRIAKIELSILRLTLYEMLYTDVPLRVIINEGIELSKLFGDESSRAFINGILDAAARAVNAGELGVKKTF